MDIKKLNPRVINNLSLEDMCRIKDNPRQRDTAQHAKSRPSYLLQPSVENYLIHAVQYKGFTPIECVDYKMRPYTINHDDIVLTDGHTRIYCWRKGILPPEPGSLRLDLYDCYTEEEMTDAYHRYDNPETSEGAMDKFERAIKNNGLDPDSDPFIHKLCQGCCGTCQLLFAKDIAKPIIGKKTDPALRAYTYGWMAEKLMKGILLLGKHKFKSGGSAKDYANLKIRTIMLYTALQDGPGFNDEFWTNFLSNNAIQHGDNGDLIWKTRMFLERGTAKRQPLIPFKSQARNQRLEWEVQAILLRAYELSKTEPGKMYTKRSTPFSNNVLKETLDNGLKRYRPEYQIQKLQTMDDAFPINLAEL